MARLFRHPMSLRPALLAALIGAAFFSNLWAVPPDSTPDLTISISHSGSFVVGSQGVYIVLVSNMGGSPTTGSIGVIDVLPAGLNYSSAGGIGWSCSALGQTVSCTNPGPLPPGMSTAIALAVDIDSSAYPGVTNTAIVSGGGESNTCNDISSDPTTIQLALTGLQFVPMAPCRIIDTRGPVGPFGGPYLSGLSTRTIPLRSSPCGVPSNAGAYSLNATVIPKSGILGYLTLWATGQSKPGVSTLNSPDGSVLANAAIVPAGAAGSINAYALQDTDLVLDINGYFAPPAADTLQFYPLPPCRVLDTRWPNGIFGGPALVGGLARSFPVQSGSCNVPATASAYSFNVTAVPHGLLGYLSVWPTGQPQPNVSTLNSLDGTILANAAIVPAGTGGAVTFYPMNTTDLVVDINGYFAPPGPGGLNFHTVTPCRIVDTRGANGPLGGPVVEGNTSRVFPLAGACGLPATAGSYSLNVTVAPSGPLGYVTVWPSDRPKPSASTLNADKGLVLANAALVPAGTNGSVTVYVLGATHLIIDTNGYYFTQ